MSSKSREVIWGGRINRSVERESASHEPIRDVCAANGADGHRAIVSVAIYLNAFDGTPSNEVKQRIGCFLATMVKFALFVAAELIGLGRINPE